MSFDDAMQLHASLICSGPVGSETIEYRRWVGPGPTDFDVTEPSALVDRSPTTPLGELLIRTVDITVSKLDLAAVTLEKDQVWVAPTYGSIAARVKHRVVKVTPGQGHWDIQAVQ